MRIRGLPGRSRAVRFLVLFIILALFSGGAAVAAQYFSIKLFGWTSTVHRENREFSAVEYLVVSVANIPLEVQAYDGDKIRLEYISETELLVEENEYELYLSQDVDFTFSLFSKDIFNYGMKIWLPNIHYRDLKLMSASGDVSVTGIDSNTLIITASSGKIRLDNITANLELTTLSGSVETRFSEFRGNCTIETVSGGVSVFMPENSAVKLNFLTKNGLLSSDFFRNAYIERKGDAYFSSGSNPFLFNVKTQTGKLEFYANNR